MNQVMIAGAIAVLVIVIGFLIKFISKGKESKIETATLEPEETKQDKEPEENKKGKTGSRKVSNWMGWIIVVVIISGVFVFVFVAPKYFKNGVWMKTGSKLSIQGSYTWEKKSDQSGRNPSQRSGGPYDVVITKDDAEGGDSPSFCFTLLGKKGLAYFYGKKKKNGLIEGWWEQKNPRESGTWNLKKDRGDPNLYTGIITEKGYPEEVPAELRLKY